MLTFASVSSCRAFRSGYAYVLRGTCYLGLTNEMPPGMPSLLKSRGPGFQMPAGSGFVPIPPDAPEPDAEALAEIVSHVYSDSRSYAERGGMGETDVGVVFAGLGEPLLRLRTLLDTVSIVRERHNGVPFRISTCGVFSGAEGADGSAVDSAKLIDALVSSSVVALGDADARRETRVDSISVALPSAQDDAKAFSEACGFVCGLAEAGVSVECTAVERDGVDAEMLKKMALGMGARSFRARTWHP